MRRRLFLVFLKDGTLLLEHLFKSTRTIHRITASVHSLVVQTAHTHSVDVVILCCLAYAVVKFLKYGGAVGLIVPLAVT